MNSCSIRDLLRLALPHGTQLLTPEQGPSHQVSHAVSLRATLPAFPELRGGELVLLSVHEALALDERLTLLRIITRLGEARIAAVAFAGLPDARATAAASALGLPLLRLPDGANPRAVEREVRYLLDSRELQMERRAAQLYQALTQHVAAGEGLEALFATLHAATGCAVAFYGAASELRYQVGVGPAGGGFHDLQPRQLADARLNGHPFLVKRVGKGQSTFGYLALAGTRLDQWDHLAASQATAALLLELSKQQAVESVEARVGGELLKSIVGGTVADMLRMQEQATELGYDLRRPHAAVLIVSADGSASAEAVRDRLQVALRRARIAAPHVLIGRAILCLVPTEPQLEAPWELVRGLAAEVPIGAGIGQPASTAGDWQRAYAEAEQALTLGRQLFGPGSLAAFRDLRVYRLLFELRSSPELAGFYRATLGALVEYDRRHHAALLETLDAYFAAQGNLSQAAERLHIHRNTLLYRLRRVAQIGGVDLESPEDMLALQLALKAHRVLSSVGTDRNF